MKAKHKTILSLALTLPLSTASAALIAGSDFSDSAVFDAPGGNYDNAATSTDDLNLADGITVSGWTGTAFIGFDANAQVGMPSDNVTKLNGDAQAQPALGASPAGLVNSSFSINIPANTFLDLTSVDWVSRQATGTATNVRWIAFNTSLDSGIIFTQVGSIRNDVDTNSVDLSGAAYQGLTNTTVTFNWYAGGTGSGDQDFDTVIINGDVTVIPEPSSAILLALAGLATLKRRRR